MKTDGRKNMHTLLGKAGCSRAADGGADSCAVASRHPGNCQRLPRMCSVLVTLHSSGVLSCRPAISHVQNPAQPPLHQACAKACMWHAGTALDKVICLHQCCVFLSLLLYSHYLKLMLLPALRLLLVSLLLAGSLRLPVGLSSASAGFGLGGKT